MILSFCAASHRLVPLSGARERFDPETLFPFAVPVGVETE
jgi:hypothetical protein